MSGSYPLPDAARQIASAPPSSVAARAWSRFGEVRDAGDVPQFLPDLEPDAGECHGLVESTSAERGDGEEVQRVRPD